MSTPNRTTTITLNAHAVEDILGQFYFALGQGAGAMRIQRSAIAALRARYADPIAANVAHWKSGAPNVLAFVTQVGRLAAQLATAAGRTFISEADSRRHAPSWKPACTRPAIASTASSPGRGVPPSRRRRPHAAITDGSGSRKRELDVYDPAAASAAAGSGMTTQHSDGDARHRHDESTANAIAAHGWGHML